MTDSVSEETREVEELESVAIRFAGDSGDGMQLTGTQFTNTSAVFGNDISTMPDFPAEIRAPAGTLAGVSGFQVHFSSRNVLTPGDAPQVLIAMNPAALKASLPELERAGTIIVNSGCVHEAEPGEGRLRLESAGGRVAGRLPGADGADDFAEPGGAG